MTGLTGTEKPEKKLRRRTYTLCAGTGSRTKSREQDREEYHMENRDTAEIEAVTEPTAEQTAGQPTQPAAGQQVGTAVSAADSQITYLEECRNAVVKLNEAKSRRETLDIQEKKQSKTLTAEKKAVEDSVNSTVKKRKDELQSSYDTEIAKVQDAIKKIRAKREKAKQQSMKERIQEQTAPYAAENKEMKARIRENFKQNRIPAICNTTMYYALYSPRTLREVLLMLVTFGVCFLGIPVGLYWLIPEHRTLHLIIIYVVTILLFGGAYLLVGGRTKERHKEAILEAQRIRRSMDKNRRKMRSLARSIRREKTEEHYDLSSFDAEISAREQEKAELLEKKEEAMAYFVNTTKPAITEEIVSARRDQINAMEAEHQQTVADLAETEEYIKNAGLKLSSGYESFIGKDFMQAEKLEALIAILQKGQAANITAAKAVYQEQNESAKR